MCVCESLFGRVCVFVSVGSGKGGKGGEIGKQWEEQTRKLQK